MSETFTDKEASIDVDCYGQLVVRMRARNATSSIDMSVRLPRHESRRIARLVLAAEKIEAEEKESGT